MVQTSLQGQVNKTKRGGNKVSVYLFQFAVWFAKLSLKEHKHRHIDTPYKVPMQAVLRMQVQTGSMRQTGSGRVQIVNWGPCRQTGSRTDTQVLRQTVIGREPGRQTENKMDRNLT